MQVNARVGLPGDRASHDVYSTERQRALLLGFPEGRQRVGRFAGLADRNDDRAFLDQRIAVAEFARVRGFGDDLRQVLHQVVTDQGRMPGGALPGQDEPPGFDELARVVRDATEGYATL